jgi:RNA polymerase sigma-70 factor (ECF subfamily)
LADRRERIVWVGSHILPHEAEVRAWLRRASVAPHEIDDIVQESYAKLSALDDVSHIQNPRAYFFQTARSILYQQTRRARIVRIDVVAELDSLNILDESPNPEEAVSRFRDLERLKAMIDTLPEKCRHVFVLRKIENLSQRDIAQRLGISENTVETHINRGLQLLLKAWAEPAPNQISTKAKANESRTRKRD